MTKKYLLVIFLLALVFTQSANNQKQENTQNDTTNQLNNKSIQPNNTSDQPNDTSGQPNNSSQQLNNTFEQKNNDQNKQNDSLNQSNSNFYCPFNNNTGQCQCEKLSYLQAQLFPIQGQASVYLNQNQFEVQFSLVTLNKNIIESLKQNNLIINDVQKALKKFVGLTVSTGGLSIQSIQKDQIFQGYQVINTIKVISSLIKFAGQVIDIAIFNGMQTVDYINFFVSPSTVNNTRKNLIVKAVQDAQNKAKLALTNIGYNIAGVKSVQLLENQNRFQQKYQQKTELYPSTTLVVLDVAVGFIIEKK